MAKQTLKPLHPKSLPGLRPGDHPDGGEGGVPGLVLRIRPNGVRSWVVRYGHGGDRVTLGPADGRKASLDLTAARKAASKKLIEIQAIGAEEFRRRIETARRAKNADKKAPTLEKMATDFLAEADLRASSRRGWESVLKASIIPTLGNRKPAQLTKDDIRTALSTVRRRSVWAADSMHKVLTWIFKLAIERDILTSSPMTGLRRADFRVKDGGRRKVVATPAELKAVWTAAGKAGAYGLAVRLGMLTLARRGEIFEAQTSEFDLEGKVWRIPAQRRKNGEALAIPLTDTSVEIVKALTATAEARGAVYLLPGDPNPESGEIGPHAPTSKEWATLMLDAGLEKPEKKIKAPKLPKGAPKVRKAWTPHPLRFHDLRRAGRSIMETELAIAASVAEGVIGHLAPSLNRTYSPDGVGLPERRRAVEKWNAHLLGIVEGTTKSERGKVVAGQFGAVR
jgi:integrase